MTDIINIWTDGTFQDQSRMGGWAILIDNAGSWREDSGFRIQGGGSACMELFAVTRALRTVKPGPSLRLHVDREEIIQLAIDLPIKRSPFIREFLPAFHDAVSAHSRIEWAHVKAHVSSPQNERVDYLARMALHCGLSTLGKPISRKLHRTSRRISLPPFLA